MTNQKPIRPMPEIERKIRNGANAEAMRLYRGTPIARYGFCAGVLWALKMINDAAEAETKERDAA